MPFVESVEFIYLRMPEVRDIGDGSQDALLVRVSDGRDEGWGECEASPVVTMATWDAPMSHSACKPVSASVLGARLDEIEDIGRIHRAVRANSFDMLQADHALSGIDMALWDLMGRRLGQPVWRLLGCERATPKRPYASLLFGETPEETHSLARLAVAQGFSAVKFGWGPFGRDLGLDHALLVAAREGLGGAELLVDAGTVWDGDIEAATQRLPLLESAGVGWLEEPFPGWCLSSYAELSKRTSIPLAGGEGCHHEEQAIALMEFGGVRFIQIDAGRIGGITSARRVARRARDLGVTYVNHTFTTSLALSASLQPYADSDAGALCEVPMAPSALAQELAPALARDAQGWIPFLDAPGLGVEPSPSALEKYRVH